MMAEVVIGVEVKDMDFFKEILQVLELLGDSWEPDKEGPKFLDWIADRMVNMYGESPDTHFILTLRRRAAKAKEAFEMIDKSELLKGAFDDE